MTYAHVPMKALGIVLGLLWFAASCGFEEEWTWERRNTDISSLPDTVKMPVPTTYNFDGLRDASGDQDELEALELRLRPEEVVDFVAEENHFVLLQGSQAGRYTLDVWYRADEPNSEVTLFLRATDLETGQFLSEQDLLERTTVELAAPPSEEFLYLPGEADNAVIYEGIPGDPYPVLFELIAASPQGERTVDEDVYLIEGFQR